MELNEALELLKEFGKAQKLQAGAITLIENLVKNNVQVNKAKQFCAEHFMSESIAQYYEDFFKYVAALKEEQAKKEEPTTAAPPQIDNTEILKSIDQTLKEILECLKNV